MSIHVSPGQAIKIRYKADITSSDANDKIGGIVGKNINLSSVITVSPDNLSLVIGAGEFIIEGCSIEEPGPYNIPAPRPTEPTHYFLYLSYIHGEGNVAKYNIETTYPNAANQLLLADFNANSLGIMNISIRERYRNLAELSETIGTLEIDVMTSDIETKAITNTNLHEGVLFKKSSIMSSVITGNASVSGNKILKTPSILTEALVGPNMLSGWLSGKGINGTSGTIENVTDGWVTGKIAVSPGMTIKFLNGNRSISRFTGVNGEYIGKSLLSELTVPAGAFYMQSFLYQGVAPVPTNIVVLSNASNSISSDVTLRGRTDRTIRVQSDGLKKIGSISDTIDTLMGVFYKNISDVFTLSEGRLLQTYGNTKVWVFTRGGIDLSASTIIKESSSLLSTKPVVFSGEDQLANIDKIFISGTDKICYISSTATTSLSVNAELCGVLKAPEVLDVNAGSLVCPCPIGISPLYSLTECVETILIATEDGRIDFSSKTDCQILDGVREIGTSGEISVNFENGIITSSSIKKHFQYIITYNKPIISAIPSVSVTTYKTLRSVIDASERMVAQNEERVSALSDKADYALEASRNGLATTVSYPRAITLETTASEVSMQIESYNPETDLVILFANGDYQMPGTNYYIVTETKKITKSLGSWNAGTNLSWLIIRSIKVKYPADYFSGQMIQPGTLDELQMSPQIQAKLAAYGTVSLDYVNSLFNEVSAKKYVKAATNGNITISGTPVIDTLQTSIGDDILVKDQTDKKSNGIYTINAGGVWTRRSDADVGSELKPGTKVFVADGLANRYMTFELQSSTIPVIGTSEINFVVSSGGVAIKPIRQSGTLSSPTARILVNIPEWSPLTDAQDSLMLYIGGRYSTFGREYTVDVATREIVCLENGGLWPSTTEYDIVLFKTVQLSMADSVLQGLAVQILDGEAIVDSGTVSGVTHNVVGFDPLKDSIDVFVGGTATKKNVDWKISSDKLKIEPVTGTWPIGLSIIWKIYKNIRIIASQYDLDLSTARDGSLKKSALEASFASEYNSALARITLAEADIISLQQQVSSLLG